MVVGLLATFFLGVTQLAQVEPSETPVAKKKEQIRVVPVTRTPESENSTVFIALPKPGEIITDQPVWVQFRTQQYSLGADSGQFERASQVAVTNMGQTVHVVIDNEPYFPVNEPAIDPFNELGNFRLTYYKFKIPYLLKDGPHTLRMFLARSFGESLKGFNTFQALNFQIGNKDASGKKMGGVDLFEPYLTYNEPSDQIPLTANKPLLLDFFLSNCELSADGYRVQLSIDGQVARVLTSWQPYYIYGLKKGTHTIRLELLDSHNTLVPGPFNDVERKILVQ